MTLRVFLLASGVGGVILFFWGFLAWVVLPLHVAFLRRFHGEEEDSLREILRRGASGRGIYVVPGLPHPRPRDRQQRRAVDMTHRERMRQGPTAFIALRPQGAPAMSAGQLLAGLVTQILAAAAMAAILWLGGATTFAARFAVVELVALTVWLAAHVPYWNWLHFSLGHTVSELVDLVVGWGLLGLWLAWVLA